MNIFILTLKNYAKFKPVCLCTFWWEAEVQSVLLAGPQRSSCSSVQPAAAANTTSMNCSFLYFCCSATQSWLWEDVTLLSGNHKMTLLFGVQLWKCPTRFGMKIWRPHWGVPQVSLSAQWLFTGLLLRLLREDISLCIAGCSL